MKRMKLSELTGNEILAQSLMTWDYQIILPEGVVLKKEYISKIEEMGILEVYVKEDQENEIAILKNDIEKTIKSKVKSILERHTYQNNKELQGLTQAADEIITNILDEKEVIEKVFDIRERSADIYEHSISLSSMAILSWPKRTGSPSHPSLLPVPYRRRSSSRRSGHRRNCRECLLRRYWHPSGSPSASPGSG